MSSKIQNEINIAAVLDAYVYFDKQKSGYIDMTLGEIITRMESNPNRADWTYYDTIKQALEQEKQNGSSYLADMVMVDQSAIDTDIPGDLLYACTFRSGNDYYIAYRGTGDGKWVDNGEGMYKDETVMQRKAADYFDLMAEKEHLGKDDNIIVTGHSKGGNSAQFATLAAGSRDLIDACYSFDGQGFSHNAIKKFRSGAGGEAAYQAQLDKMYSINGVNDPVHELGIAVIPPDHTYIAETRDGSDPGSWHGLEYMIAGGQVNVDFEHRISQGPIAEFAKALSAEMMKLSDEDLEDCALSIMSLIERYAFGGEDHLVGTGDEKFASIEEFCGFISVGIPLILKTALLTEEGRALVGILAMNAVQGIASSENGGLKLAGITALVIACAPAVVALGTSLWGAATVMDIALGVFDDKFELSDIAGVGILGVAIAGAAMFLATHPHIVAAVLGFAAVVSLINFAIQHWDDICAFAKAAGDFAVGAAVAISAWIENLVAQGTALVRSAIAKAAEFFQNAKQAILDFGEKLAAGAAGFFGGIARAVGETVGGFCAWVQGLFGNGASALKYGREITVTVSYIEDVQHRMGLMRSSCLALNDFVRGADAAVSRVYGYYRESYVRSCCRSIQTELKAAQRYLNAVETDLERKRNVLRTAVESYRRADRDAANEIRRFSISYA